MDQEILTPDEFAQKLKIGRSTLFDWMRNGTLISGKHYIKIGRVVRFSWNEDVLFSLEIPKAKIKITKISRQHQSAVNWNN